MIPDVPSICCGPPFRPIPTPAAPGPRQPSIILTQVLFLWGLALPSLLDVVLALVSADAGSLSGLDWSLN